MSNSLFPIANFSRDFSMPAMREFDALFNSFFDGDDINKFTKKGGALTVPRANIIKTEEGYNVQLAAPGFSRGDFDITIENSTLTISSDKKNITENPGGKVTSREYTYSNFSRSWTLPKDVNAENVSARYEAGILSVLVPISENDRKKTTIKVG